MLDTTGSDTLHYCYDSRGQLVSFKLNGTPYFYTRNGQGDITGLIDASGDVTGVGVADVFLLGPLGGGVGQGLMMIFG